MHHKGVLSVFPLINSTIILTEHLWTSAYSLRRCPHLHFSQTMNGIISPHTDLSIIIDTELLIGTSAGKLQPISQTLSPSFEKSERFDGVQLWRSSLWSVGRFTWLTGIICSGKSCFFFRIRRFIRWMQIQQQTNTHSPSPFLKVLMPLNQH